jgi:putative DNA primase/helicase
VVSGVVSGASVQLKPVSWLWQDYLLAGKLNILAGAPGSGKTAVALSLTATVSRGGAWPDKSAAPSGDVLIWSRGEGLRDLVLPRYVACGGDLGRVSFSEGADQRTGAGEAPEQGAGAGKSGPEWEVEGFDAERDLPVLRNALRQGGQWKLLVVDGLAASGGAGFDSLLWDLKALAELAEETGCTILGVVDTGRIGGRDVAARLVQAVGRGAHARMLLHAARRGTPDGGHVLTRVRSRFGPEGDGFDYWLEWVEPPGGVAASRVMWGGRLEGTPDHIVEEAQEDPLVAAFNDRSAWVREEAMEFLELLLAQGPVPVARLRQDVNGAGHSWATVRRAKRALGVRADKSSISGVWSWSLGPRGAPKPPAAGQVAHSI